MRRALLLLAAALSAAGAAKSASIHIGARRASRLATSGLPAARLAAEAESAVRLDPAAGGDLPRIAAAVAAGGAPEPATRLARDGFRRNGTSALLFLEATLLAERAASDAGAAERARLLFERIRLDAPEDPTAAQNLLRLHVEAADDEALGRLAMEGLRRRPEAFDLLVARGNAELRSGDLLAASRSYRLALAAGDLADRPLPVVFREDETRRVFGEMSASLGVPGGPAWGRGALPSGGGGPAR